MRALSCLALLLAIGGLACAPASGPVDVEALVRDPHDPERFVLDTVTLEQVDDIHTGRGADFDVRGGYVISQSILDDVAAQDLDLDEMIERARRNDGHDVAPRIGWDGSRWVAHDFDSLVYLTVLHNFEASWRFYEDVVGDASGATRDHAIVGFYGEVQALDWLPLPLLTSDNAAYVAFSDGWLTLRTVRSGDGVPFAMNSGIIAHEFGHRQFFHNVFAQEAFDTWRDWATSGGGLSRDALLIRGLDEGLADIFAAGQERTTTFMNASFKGLYDGHGDFRDLDADFAREATYEGLAADSLGLAVSGHCGTQPVDVESFPAEEFNYYCLGTVVARALFEGAGEDFDVLRDEVLPAVNRSLRAVGREVKRRSDEAGELRFEIEIFLEAAAAEMPPARRPVVCAAFEARFQTRMTADKVPSCF